VTVSLSRNGRGSITLLEDRDPRTNTDCDVAVEGGGLGGTGASPGAPES
jgi:hypothetical protein